MKRIRNWLMQTASEKVIGFFIHMILILPSDAPYLLSRLENRKLADIPIIAMTANAFEEDRQAAIKAGMDDHLAKPIQIEKLYEMMKKYL